MPSMTGECPIFVAATLGNPLMQHSAWVIPSDGLGSIEDFQTGDIIHVDDVNDVTVIQPATSCIEHRCALWVSIVTTENITIYHCGLIHRDNVRGV
jgi:hypothetical protein